MKDGDVAGFSAFNGHSGLLSVVKEGDAKRLVMSTNVVNFDNTPNKAIASVDIEEKEQVEFNQDVIYLRIEGDFIRNAISLLSIIAWIIRNGKR